MTASRSPLTGGFHAVFFDLDGTLVDTAPDMVAVLARMLRRHGKTGLPYELARNNVSNGAIGLLKLGFPDADDEQLKTLHTEYLDDYENSLCVDSSVFSPLSDLLNTLSAGDRAWGIVTNKPERMTTPLLTKLGIGSAAACVVSGDTLPEKKPHPAPLLHAAGLAGVAPGRTVYVGDAARDIQAGKAAGMATVSVGYGYIAAGDDPMRWNADAHVADTMSLMQLLLAAVGIDPT